MALQVAAVLAALAVAERFCQVGLVKRLLENWSHGTSNTVDDWVVDALTDSEPTMIPKILEAVQATYNKLEGEKKIIATAPVPLPVAVEEALIASPAFPWPEPTAPIGEP